MMHDALVGDLPASLSLRTKVRIILEVRTQVNELGKLTLIRLIVLWSTQLPVWNPSPPLFRRGRSGTCG